jgi:modification methylase
MGKMDLPLDRVIQGDCLELLPKLPPESVDLVFADPPYNLQLSQALYRPNSTEVDGVDDGWDRFDGFADYDRFTRAWLAACRRALKPAGSLWVIGTYHNIYRVGSILQDLGFWLLNDVLWIKTNPMPNFRGARFTNAHETLLWASKGRSARYTFNYHAMKALNQGKQMRSDWVLPICSGPERIRVNGKKAHPTQKPEALLYRVLLASTQPGQVVLDPFFGVGTTGAVAKRLGRRWIGIEREADYARLAEQRIRAVEAEAFDPQVFAVGGRRRAAEPVPFSALLEAGLLRPGQKLYFQRDGILIARVKPDGNLRQNGLEGSIHQVGRALAGGPCNGWEHWYFRDRAGRLRAIDELRQRLRAEMELPASADERHSTN